MLANCANPKCSNHFLRMSEGKLFWQETQLDREITSSSESHLQLFGSATFALRCVTRPCIIASMHRNRATTSTTY